MSEKSAPRVLIVDDVPRMRAAMRELLEIIEVDVVGEAADGKDAVRMAPLLVPDVILMDLRMPVMDGLEATRRIHGMGLGSQVVMCTAFDGPTVHDRAKAAGAFDVIAKGEHPRKLLALIERAWRARYTGSSR